MYTGEDVVPRGAPESVESINSALRDAIYDIPHAMREALPGLHENIVQVGEALDVVNLSHLHFTGCGDSYYAGIAAARYLDGWSGLRVDAVEALECARYSLPHFDSSDLIIAISNSGEVSRTVEVAELAERRGLGVVAITDARGSRLAQAVGHTVGAGMPSKPSGGAGSRSYAGSLMAAFVLGSAIATQREKSDSSLRRCVDDIERAAGDVEASLQTDDPRDFAAWLDGHDTVVILGAGPQLATALFLGAKLMEAASVHGVVQGLEEWAHEQFHVTDQGLPTVVFGAPGASHDRAVEQARAVRDLGGPLWVVTTDDDDGYNSLGGVSHYLSTQSETLGVFPGSAVAARMALAVAERRGVAMRMRLDEARKQLNFQSIFNSDVSRDEDKPKPLGEDA